MHPDPYQPLANITILTRAFARNAFAWALFLGSFDKLTVGALWNVSLPHLVDDRDRTKSPSLICDSLRGAQLI
jgi:hypothetical protein